MPSKLKIILFVGLAAILCVVGESDAWQLLRMSGGTVAFRPTALGARPSVGNPPATLLVNYDVHVAPSGTSDVIGDAMTVWSSVSGSTLNFDFDATPVASCCVNGENCACDDGINTVSWVETKWPWGSSALAVTFKADYDSLTGVVNETDMQINGQDFSWSLDGTPGSKQYDLLSVVTHELGHMCMLDDLYDKLFYHSTMYGYIAAGTTTSASLDEDDMDGMRYMYPASEGDVPPPRVTGFVKSGETTSMDKLIEYSGASLTNVTVKGFGFVNAPTLQVWQSGAEVSNPKASLAGFTDYASITMNVDFTGVEGGYDLKVANPNGKFDLVEGAIQVNAAGNTPPSVTAPADINATVGSAYELCATGNDPTGDGDGDAPLTYSWSVAIQPEGSAATLTNANTSCASLKPDKSGYYLLNVSVSDGIVVSYTDATLVTARPAASSGGGGGGGGGSSGCSISGNADVSGFFMMIIFPPIIFILLKKAGIFSS